MLIGTVGFTAVSIAGFAVWAFGGRWFRSEVSLYAASAAVFIAASGLFLHRLIDGAARIVRFYKAFIPAFLAYALVWCLCWFEGRDGAGEWLGSLFGCAAFVVVLAAVFRNWRNVVLAVLLVFALHSAGYFAGGWAYKRAGATARRELGWSRQTAGVVARLSWGLFYGLGFGAGIGFAFHTAQTRKTTQPT